VTVLARDSKAVDLASAIASISSGSSIALGGNVNNNVAMAAVRELIRHGTGELELMAFGQGIGADMLLGAGAVSRLHTNYLGLEHLGLAPSFRRIAEAEAISVIDWDSLGMMLALEAAASGAPFAALPRGIEATAWPELSPSVYRRVPDPFTGEPSYVVPSLSPDVAVLYASRADPFGNAQHDGFVFWDELIAQAAERVIIVCEELVSNETIREAPHRTAIPSYLVDLVVESSRAAYPCGAPPRYDADLEEIVRYQAAAATQTSMARYLDEVRQSSEPEPSASHRGES
jgi:glutaconate CoA-transferase, subunit A